MAAIISGGAIAYAKFEAMETPSDDAAYMHVQMGNAVFIIACINFGLGLIRPHKGFKIRILWYFLHFTCGTCVVAFAWYTIYTGMNAYEDSWVSPTGSTLHDLQVSTVQHSFVLCSETRHSAVQLCSVQHTSAASAQMALLCMASR